MSQRKITGRVLSLATDYAVGSFGHFLHDGISRFPLVLRAGFAASDFDWLYLPRMQTVAVNKITAQLGFKPSQILNYTPGLDLEVEELCGTSYPCSVGHINSETGRDLRQFGDAFRLGGAAYPKRILLSRKGYSRNFGNEAEIDAVFKRHGFLSIDPGTEPLTIEYCANADIIAGIDGSNMANIGIAREGAKVLLIIPPVYSTPPYHLTTAVSGGRSIHVLQGDPMPGEKPDYLSDFVLSPDALHRCLVLMSLDPSSAAVSLA